MTGPAIVVFGMPGPFSRVTLETLLAADVNVQALLVPTLRPDAAPWRVLPAPRRAVHAGPPSTNSVAWRHRVPIVEVGHPLGAVAPDALVQLEAAAFVVACFPWRLPRGWIDAAPWGALNLHPSLLPAYRGPTPLFWQLRAGERETGITLHQVDEGLDTGSIVEQAPVELVAGASQEDIETLLAEVGAGLLVKALSAWPSASRPQPDQGASRQGLPAASDLRVETSWSARRAFDFVRGAARFGPFQIGLPEGSLCVAEALRFSPDGGTPGTVRSLPDGTEVGFTPGTLVVC
jgi:methionyl-tRNA formyltransferase